MRGLALDEDALLADAGAMMNDLQVAYSTAGGTTAVLRCLKESGYNPHWDTVANWARRNRVPTKWLIPLQSSLASLGVDVEVAELAALIPRRTQVRPSRRANGAAILADKQALTGGSVARGCGAGG